MIWATPPHTPPPPHRLSARRFRPIHCSLFELVHHQPQRLIQVFLPIEHVFQWQLEARVLSFSLSVPSTGAVYITCVCERETRATPTTPEDSKVPIGGGADDFYPLVISAKAKRGATVRPYQTFMDFFFFSRSNSTHSRNLNSLISVNTLQRFSAVGSSISSAM